MRYVDPTRTALLLWPLAGRAMRHAVRLLELFVPLLSTFKWSRCSLRLRAPALSRRRSAGVGFVWALGFSLCLSACGPFGYIGKVSQKSVDAVEKAEKAQAETYAPYEYWAAKTYLERARVMMTYSEYERAFDYGSRAQQLAEAAERKAKQVKEEEAKAASQAPAPKRVAGGTR